MYNFELMNNEEVIKILNENIYKTRRYCSRTNKRLLFLDYLVENEELEVLRITRGADYIKYKENYYQIDLNDMSFEFNDDALYKLLIGVYK